MRRDPGHHVRGKERRDAAQHEHRDERQRDQPYRQGRVGDKAFVGQCLHHCRKHRLGRRGNNHAQKSECKTIAKGNEQQQQAFQVGRKCHVDRKSLRLELARWQAKSHSAQSIIVTAKRLQSRGFEKAACWVRSSTRPAQLTQKRRFALHRPI